MRRQHALPIGVAIAAIGLAACGTEWSGSQAARQIELAPSSVLPPDIQQASPQVQEAYRFAIANPDLLSQFPCYCGCGAVGHTNNYDCYVQAAFPDGSLLLDYHASY